MDDTTFSADEVRVLASVLDEVIPPSRDGALPGAGGLGLAQHVEEAMRRAPELRAAIRQGLNALEALARERSGRGFDTLSSAERLALINELAPTDNGFPPMLFMYAYTAYYQHPRVLESLGLDPRPPHPQGYEMAPDDFSLLDVVRSRPKSYREC